LSARRVTVMPAFFQLPAALLDASCMLVCDCLACPASHQLS